MLCNFLINIKKIFAPEHGFRGEADAGEQVVNGTDSKSGIKIISLYGDKKKPSKEDLKDLDSRGLLGCPENESGTSLVREEPSDEALLAELGVKTETERDITRLTHVRSREEIKAAEEIANREKCDDFERFEPLFRKVERELKSGTRKTIRFGQDAAISKGDFFMLSGQVVYIAEVGEEIKAPNGANDARLRAIYSNGTESNLLRR